MTTPASGIKLEPIRMSAVIDTGVIIGSTKSGYVHPNKRTKQTIGSGLVEFNDTDFPSLSMAATASIGTTKMNFKKVVDDCIEKEKANILNTDQYTVRSWSDMTPEQRKKAGIITVSIPKNPASITYQASSDTYGQLQ